MARNLLLVISLLMIISGCKKAGNSKTEIEAVKSCRISTIERSLGGGGPPNTYIYDENERLIKITDGQNPSISYSTNKISVKYESGPADITYNLDASGRVVSGTDCTFKYNSEGYLIESFRDFGSFTITVNLTYENGNLIKAEQHTKNDNGSQFIKLYTYSYTSDPFTNAGEDSNPLTNDMNVIQPEALSNFFGKPVKNRISKKVITGPGSPYTFTFAYHKNADGNISLVEINLDGSPFKKNILTYDCK